MRPAYPDLTVQLLLYPETLFPDSCFLLMYSCKPQVKFLMSDKVYPLVPLKGSNHQSSLIFSFIYL